MGGNCILNFRNLPCKFCWEGFTSPGLLYFKIVSWFALSNFPHVNTFVPACEYFCSGEEDGVVSFLLDTGSEPYGN